MQALLEARGLDGTEPHLKGLIRKAVAAFKAHDLAGVTAAAGAMVDAIEGGAG